MWDRWGCTPAHLLGVAEQRQHERREVVRVHVGEAQVVGRGVEQVVAALVVQLTRQLREDVHRRRRADGLHRWLAARQLLDRLSRDTGQ